MSGLPPLVPSKNLSLSGKWPSPKEEDEGSVPRPSPLREGLAKALRALTPSGMSRTSSMGSFFFGRSRAPSSASEEPGAVTNMPSVAEIKQDALIMKERRDTFSKEEKAMIEAYSDGEVKRYLESNSQEEIRRDPLYNQAFFTPSKFIDKLMRAANFESMAGGKMFTANDIEKMRNMITPELVRAAVTARKASWILTMAESPCFKDFIESSAAKKAHIDSGVEDAETTLRNCDKTDEQLVEDNEQAVAFAKMGIINQLWSFAGILLEGVDFTNWSHYTWNFPPEVVETEAKRQYILDHFLSPTGLLNTRSKGENCKSQIAKPAAANASSRSSPGNIQAFSLENFSRSETPQQLSRKASNSNMSGLPPGGGTRRRRRRRQTRRR